MWKLTPAQFFALANKSEADVFLSDHRAGLIVSTIANVHRDPKKKRKPYEWTDFFKAWKGVDKQKQQMSEREMLAYWEGVIVPSVKASDSKHG